MLESLSGATRVAFIVGDPIAQVKSPGGLTKIIAAKGENAIVVPAHVSPQNLDTFVHAVDLMQNVDCIIITVPHKFAIAKQCKIVSEVAKFVGAVNIMRRLPEGGWAGENYDGLGFVNGLRAAGCKVEGARALMVGTGGAGAAIAFELLNSGKVDFLQVYDLDEEKAKGLVARLETRFAGKVAYGAPDPEGFSLICNASPCGMKPTDPMPVDVSRLDKGAFVGDAITVPEPTQMVAEAKKRGHGTMTGLGMFNAQAQLLADFVLEADTSSFVANHA